MNFGLLSRIRQSDERVSVHNNWHNRSSVASPELTLGCLCVNNVSRDREYHLVGESICGWSRWINADLPPRRPLSSNSGKTGKLTACFCNVSYSQVHSKSHQFRDSHRGLEEGVPVSIIGIVGFLNQDRLNLHEACCLRSNHQRFSTNTASNSGFFRFDSHFSRPYRRKY